MTNLNYDSVGKVSAVGQLSQELSETLPRALPAVVALVAQHTRLKSQHIQTS